MGALGGVGGDHREPTLLLLQLMFSAVGTSVSFIMKFSPLFCGLKGFWKFHCFRCLALLLTIRWEGKILLDFLFLKNKTVDIKTVKVTMTIMTPANKPRICMGFSLLCIKKEAKGPLS